MKTHARIWALLLCTLIAVPAAATSVTGVRITRLNRISGGDVLVQVSVPPGTLACLSTFPTNEIYIYDPETDAGRILDAQMRAAYTTNAFVDLLGTGTCVVFGTPPFQSRYERIATFTLR